MIQITSELFAVAASGEKVVRYTMTNARGTSVFVLDYGCIIQKIMVKDRDGVERDFVLGFDNLLDCENSCFFFGALIGRYANRIKNASFELNGISYQLEKNFGNHHIHGILSFQVFEGIIEDDCVCFKKFCPSEEEGYPGNLHLEVRYRLTEDDALEIDYRAVSDEDTVLNLTNHTYFNLNGQDGSTVMSHRVFLDADQMTEIDSTAMMTGKIRSVENTPMDFRKAKPIGRDIRSDYDQLRYCSGYDFNYILKGRCGTLRKIASVESDVSGIVLDVYTTEAAVQFYTGNFIHQNTIGKNGVSYPTYGGVCFETQRSPCAPNYPQFPSAVLRKGETYLHRTIYKFLVKD